MYIYLFYEIFFFFDCRFRVAGRIYRIVDFTVMEIEEYSDVIGRRFFSFFFEYLVIVFVRRAFRRFSVY